MACIIYYSCNYHPLEDKLSGLCWAMRRAPGTRVAKTACDRKVCENQTLFAMRNKKLHPCILPISDITWWCFCLSFSLFILFWRCISLLSFKRWNCFVSIYSPPGYFQQQLSLIKLRYSVLRFNPRPRQVTNMGLLLNAAVLSLARSICSLPVPIKIVSPQPSCSESSRGPDKSRDLGARQRHANRPLGHSRILLTIMMSK